MPKALDFHASHPVTYCIPLWLRDLQMEASTKRIQARVQEGDLKAEPIAIVAYGPSLNDTWERIKGFRYVMSCSGAHRFLIDRGVIPTWHVEVDPRPHKVQLIGTPHPDVEYLPSSTCAPAYFDWLEQHHAKISLWHVFDNSEDGLRTLPPGEWALTGGASVGLRCLTIARFLGFTDLHIFGMDGCEGVSGKHAAEHPNQPKDHALTTYQGVEYRTTTSMLECAKQTFHELNQLKDVRATFYGEGLVQAMAKDWTPAYKETPTFIGLHKAPLISEDYRRLNAQLHASNLAYGVGGGKHADTVKKLAESLKTTSVLDYGAGKGYLAKALPFPIWEYDPAIPEKSQPPRAADLVVCTDVLDHIETDTLQHVLGDLQRVTKKVGYFVIHTGPAGKTLPDGRNTHLIQRGEAWWRKNLSRYFSVGKVIEKGPLLHVVVAPKQSSMTVSARAAQTVEAIHA
jgi:hypothetical protein